MSSRSKRPKSPAPLATTGFGRRGNLLAAALLGLGLGTAPLAVTGCGPQAADTPPTDREATGEGDEKTPPAEEATPAEDVKPAEEEEVVAPPAAMYGGPPVDDSQLVPQPEPQPETPAEPGEGEGDEEDEDEGEDEEDAVIEKPEPRDTVVRPLYGMPPSLR